MKNQRNLQLAVLGLVGIFSLIPADRSLLAQTVCLPLPRLLSTMPMGGQAGTQFEITVTGENLDDGGELLFSTPGLTAVRRMQADGQPEPGRYVVTVAADCPPGLYETRMMTRLGISSARIFSVGALQEVTQTAGNTSVAAAMPLQMDTVCNSVMSARSIDYYSFDAEMGQRCFVHCAAKGIDSKLDAVLVVANAAGQDLLVERQGGVLDFTAPSAGRYIVKVHELTYKGGPGYFYRLSLQRASQDAPVPVFASTRTVSSFSWPPQGLAESSAALEQEPNNSGEQANRISLPCDLSGAFATAADVDTYEFTASKGDVWWIEVASERLGRPTDPSVVIQQVTGELGQEVVTDLVELTDIPSPMKPSSNGYAYDGPPYDGGSADLIGKLEIPQDGRYRLQVTDLFGGTRTDPRNIYRLIVRRAAPDFAVCAWGLHMELRNGDRNALSKPLALRGGVTTALEVVAVRRDGFDGPIELVLDGLPEGVTASGLTIPPGQTRGIVLVTADQNAPRALTFANFIARASIAGQSVERPCHVAAVAWPIVDSWSEIPVPRLVQGVPVSVSGSEVAPLTIAARENKVWEVKAGEKLTIPLIHTRRTEFSGGVLQLKTFGHGFENNPQFDVLLTEDTSQAVLDTAALKTPPGEYQIAFYGSAVAKYQYFPEGVAQAASVLKAAEEQASLAAENLKKLEADVATAADDQKSLLAERLEAARVQQQQTAAALMAATQKHKLATEQSAPRDTVDIVISEPIAVKVLPGEAQ